MAEKPIDSNISPSEGTASSTLQAASTIEKKIRRAERFGVPVKLSEEEKRTSRAERFGTNPPTPGKDVGVSEEQKRRDRAKRFGLVEHYSGDEAAKKKARLERFAQKPNALEEEKRKARAARFSGTSNSSAQNNGKKADKVETAGGT